MSLNRLLKVSLFALSVFATTQVVVAAPTPEQMAAFEASPENERVKLLITLAKAGRAEDVNSLLAAYPLSGPHAKNRNLFIQGLLLKAEGDLTGAADLFRDALANDASLTLVRAELAQTLVVLQEDDSAKHHLQLLANDAPDAQAAGTVRSFIDQIDNRKTFTKSAYISVAPSTNVNGGSRHKSVFDAGIPGVGLQYTQPESGIGAAVGGNIGYNRRLGNHFSFVAAGGVDLQIYDDSDFNSYNMSQSFEIRRLIEKGHVSVGAVTSQTLDNNDFGLSYLSYGPRLALSLQASQRDHLSASATYEWRNNTDKGVNDSTALMLDASWSHGFSSSLTTSLFGGYDYVDTDFDPTSYHTMSGGFSIYKELPFGVSTTLWGQVANNRFVGVNASIGDEREDVKATGMVRLTKRDWSVFGFAPSAQYTFSENFSNLNVYDIKSHAFDIRLTKDF